MAFKSTKELGYRDPRISAKGRPKKDPNEVKTKRQVREEELLGILRRIKPHLSESITTAAKIMKNTEATDSNRLKAAVILLDAYKELVNDVYDGEDREEEGIDVNDSKPEATPVFSLKIINPD